MYTESYYEPTDADLLDWQEHCMMLDAEERDEQEEDFGNGEVYGEEDEYIYEEDGDGNFYAIHRPTGLGYRV